MKKLLSVLLVMSFVLAMTSCGSTTTNSDEITYTVSTDGHSDSVSNVSDSTDVSTVVDSTVNESTGTSVSNLVNSDISTSTNAATTKPENSTTKSDNSISYSYVDYDLTTLNSTMVYSQVSDMVNNPTKYSGKIVKMTGPFSVYETTSRNYYACLITDATACCSQGIEFKLADTSLNYPDDYPQLGDYIYVIGKFHHYNEGDYSYIELIDAVIVSK